MSCISINKNENNINIWWGWLSWYSTVSISLKKHKVIILINSHFPWILKIKNYKNNNNLSSYKKIFLVLN